MKQVARKKRHLKVRKHLSGTPDRPRLAVFRSGQHIYVQLIDDTKGKTLVAESDLKLAGSKQDRAYEVGKKLAERAKKHKIVEAVFDRGGFLYHGRIARLAQGAREGGLKI
ncbi:50S ribosomal protein L18 [Candidatus Daviesbacteria bacterium]|nr:50S ribosomal protein L18 [Candidatus Daviesbacteria bacterium]